MCRADLRADRPRPSLSPLLTYQRKLTHLPEKREEKFLFEKEKPPTWNRSIRTHVSSFISNVGSWNRRIRMECWNWRFFCRASGTGALWWNPAMSRWLKEPLNGIIARREGEGRPGATIETPDFHQPLALPFEISLLVSFSLSVCLCFSLSLFHLRSYCPSLTLSIAFHEFNTSQQLQIILQGPSTSFQAWLHSPVQSNSGTFGLKDHTNDLIRLSSAVCGSRTWAMFCLWATEI